MKRRPMPMQGHQGPGRGNVIRGPWSTVKRYGAAMGMEAARTILGSGEGKGERYSPHAARQKAQEGGIFHQYELDMAKRNIKSESVDLRVRAVEKLCKYGQEAELMEILRAVMKGGNEKQVDKMVRALARFWTETGSEHVLEAIGAIAINQGGKFPHRAQMQAYEMLGKIEDAVGRQATGI
ncbi:MAG: hypothetical protein COT15_01050 [Candidatus Diapherotrites archaeon CG08_land_8_20_14_0_20_34_12]|nr:MAG: hypothetical protein COT15_01050 [Candidatus Diapherotrites archaeon CG08_land_8_20_14_0_20_34_12]